VQWLYRVIKRNEKTIVNALQALTKGDLKRNQAFVQIGFRRATLRNEKWATSPILHSIARDLKTLKPWFSNVLELNNVLLLHTVANSPQLDKIVGYIYIRGLSCVIAEVKKR